MSIETKGYEAQKEPDDKDLLVEEGKEAEKIQKMTEELGLDQEQPKADAEKTNASERINLQNIMELREAFDLADLDRGGALEIGEFIQAFGEVIGKNMSHKQLKQLFMKIDADSNGSVEWPEFMNYMLLENQTLALMKKELSEYIPSTLPDPKPMTMQDPLLRGGSDELDTRDASRSSCHANWITDMVFIYPEGWDSMPAEEKELQRKNIQYATASRDGTVKIWSSQTAQCVDTIVVAKGVWVTCLCYMQRSGTLVAGSANRRISFYKLKSNASGASRSTPNSRFEDLIGIPLCLEYYEWPKNNDGKYETLLVGNELGLCTMYDFHSPDWHHCVYKVDVADLQKEDDKKGKSGSFIPKKRAEPDQLTCHADKVLERFNQMINAQFDEKQAKIREEREAARKMKHGSDSSKDKKDERKKPIKFKIDANMYIWPPPNERAKMYEQQSILMHNSWITKIKYYPDLQYIISASQDSLIHIHDIDLKYKQKTFNLHQKGVSSFHYSRKHKFVASCGEERHIIIWNPYTRRVVTYLHGHTTSIKDLAMNEERHHLISLGTDKTVIIWDKTFQRIQSIMDKTVHKLEGILYDPWTNNILLGSKKVNRWNFHTQEEIKTSHEYPVTFALNNIEKFESVISADDGGFISVWDIENGKLLFKFGDTHGSKGKITAGCFDSGQRRLITAGKDGCIRMWNFSNGSNLKELEFYENFELKQPLKNPVMTEITNLVCVYDPDDEESMEDAHCVGVGWDRKLYDWSLAVDEEEDENRPIISKPQAQSSSGLAKQGHKDDIMSCIYCRQNGLIYTGGHDGSLIAWSFETGSIKRTLHDQNDPTCTLSSGDAYEYIKKSKSVDGLLILEEREKLLSMSADQMLRFWDIYDRDLKIPCFRFECNHPDDDNLTAVAVTLDNNFIITGDTQGQIKLWDVSQVDFEDQSTDKFFIEKYFIAAHRSMINQISVVEVFENVVSERLIISASHDCNINLHRLRDGVKIGQFGQANAWNLKDMSIYDKKRPNYVRQWYLRLRTRMKELKAQREKKEVGQDQLERIPTEAASPTKIEKAAATIQGFGSKIEAEEAAIRELRDDDYPMNEDLERRPQSEQDDWLADNIDFSDEEDLTQAKGYITNAPMYQQRNQGGRNKGMPERKGGLGGKRQLYLGKEDFVQADPFQTYLATTKKHRGLGMAKFGNAVMSGK